MAKFKVGDRVRCISNIGYTSLKVGETAFITMCHGLQSNGVQFYRVGNPDTEVFVDNEECYCGAYEDEIELVQEKIEITDYTDCVVTYQDEYVKSLSDFSIMGAGGVVGLKNNKKTIMSKITEFAKNLVLSADEKLLRKHNLKDSCGGYTDDAKQLIIDKIIKDNESYLIEIAKGLEEETNNK